MLIHPQGGEEVALAAWYEGETVEWGYRPNYAEAFAVAARRRRRVVGASMAQSASRRYEPSFTIADHGLAVDLLRRRAQLEVSSVTPAGSRLNDAVDRPRWARHFNRRARTSTDRALVEHFARKVVSGGRRRRR